MHIHRGLPAVMVVVYSRNPDQILLIKNRQGGIWWSWWKFIGEEMEPGEVPLETVIRALWEEGGFMARLDDPEMSIEEVRPVERVFGNTPHERYFFKVRIPNARLRDLGEKEFPGMDPDEYFRTKIFSFEDVGSMSNFFKLHHPLFKQFLGFTA
ncbi:NUDIX hydrolase [Patescibacteria group bacterium]|nr:NUDIX hydrolase [Patescibacteria group bacterium]